MPFSRVALVGALAIVAASVAACSGGGIGDAAIDASEAARDTGNADVASDTIVTVDVRDAAPDVAADGRHADAMDATTADGSVADALDATTPDGVAADALDATSADGVAADALDAMTADGGVADALDLSDADLSPCTVFVGNDPVGSDSNDGSPARPLRTIGAGIRAAASRGAGAVCVCTTTTSDANLRNEFAESVTMVSGVSVYGGYHCPDWARDPQQYHTHVIDITPEGIVFPAGIGPDTILDGMDVEGQGTTDSTPTSGVMTMMGTAAGITVYDAAPTLTGLDVIASNRANVFALRVVSSGVAAPVTINAGFYWAFAFDVTYPPAIATTATTISLEGGSATFNAVGIRAGERSNFAQSTAVTLACSDCGPTTLVGGYLSIDYGVGTSTNIAITGNASGFTIDGTNVRLGGGSVNAAGAVYGTATGLVARSCTGPLTVRNVTMGGTNSTTVTGIESDCDVTIADSSVAIQFASTMSGLLLRAGAAVTNTSVSVGDGSNESVGIEFDGSAGSFRGNTIQMGLTGRATALMSGDMHHAAVRLNGDALLDGNLIGASCRPPTAPVRDSRLDPSYGVQVGAGASVTLVNNVVHDSTNTCVNSMDLIGVDGSATLHAVNNTMTYTTCSNCGARVGLAVQAPSTGVAGGPIVFDNNIVENTGSAVTNGVPVVIDALAPPVGSFASNDLYDPFAAALVRNRGASITTRAGVDAMIPHGSGTLSAEADYGPGWQLLAASPCRNTGNPANAPSTDRDGQTRPQEGMVDIGADEFAP